MTAHIYQIVSTEKARHERDPGFAELNNVASARPDWRDYWAIWQFFLTQPLDDAALYGFLPEDFQSRTGLTADAVQAFIDANPGHDVYTFSPPAQLEECFWNVFDQEERRYPGFTDVAMAALKEVPLAVDLRSLPMDDRSTLQGNYLVAKPSFWRTWFALTERLFDLMEGESSHFRERLDSMSIICPPMGVKTVLIDRATSLVLALSPALSVCPFDLRSTQPSPDAGLEVYRQQVGFLKELKAGYIATKNDEYLTNFHLIRDAVLRTSRIRPFATIKSADLPASMPVADDLLYVCFTHVPLSVQFPSFVSTICLGDAQGPGKINLRDLAPEWEQYHPLLGATAGSFALKNYLVAHGSQARRVGICQYRKFVSNRKISSTVASNYQLMDIVEQGSLNESALAEVMWPGDRDFLLGQLGAVAGNYFNQYKDVHVTEDFLRFTAAAVELCALDKNEVMPFFSQQAFAPGGVEIGVLPVDFWIDSITKIEAVVRECVTRFPLRRGGYQTRSWAFCAERLGSYYLLRHLVSTFGPEGWRAQMTGQLNLVTVGERSTYVPGC